MNPISRKIEEGIDEGIFPGGVFLAAAGENVLYEGAFGDASIVPERDSLNIDTIFDISSLTKPICTVSVFMVLRKSYGLNLDAAVSKFLPAFKTEEKRKITIRHLLKHTSGLPAWGAYFEEIAKKHPGCVGSREAIGVLIDMIGNESLEYPPGFKRIYGDLGYILLGRIAEIISMKTLDILFNEEVAGPLGLNKTFFRPLGIGPRFSEKGFAATENCSWRKRVMRGEVHDWNAYVVGGVAGHAGLFQTIKDCHKFVLAVLGAYDGDSSWIPAEVVRDFIGPNVKMKIGWDVPAPKGSQAGRYFSENSIGHLGFTGCSLWIDLEKKFHMIFFSNRIHPQDKKDNKIKKFRSEIHDLAYETLFR